MKYSGRCRWLTWGPWLGADVGADADDADAGAGADVAADVAAAAAVVDDSDNENKQKQGWQLAQGIQTFIAPCDWARPSRVADITMQSSTSTATPDLILITRDDDRYPQEQW